jgi:hypothetical protein
VARRSRRPPTRAPRTLTASARRLRAGSVETRTQRPWQERCWDFYDELGLIKDAAHFYARTLSKIELYPAVRSADGRTIYRVSTPEAVSVLERIQDATGTRAHLQAMYGIQKFVAGESFLTVMGRDGGEEWAMLSGSELRVSGDGTYTRDAGDGRGAQTFREPPEDATELRDGDMMVWRLWTPHPRKSGEADSTLRGVMEECERLLTLGRAIRARSRSRLAGAGLLFFADEITSMASRPAPADSAPDDQETGDATEAPEEDPVMAEIYDAMTEPIVEEGHASSVVPVMLRIPAELMDKAMRHELLSDAVDYPEAKQVEQEIRRIAMSLDMPAESLLGVADMNHWSAWVVSREAWQSHGQPVVEEFCADLTQAYFRPSFDLLGLTRVDIEVQGNPDVMDVAPGEVFVWYDAAEVVLNPDRAKDSKDAHDRLVISDATLREELGFDDDDAPDEEELTRRVDQKRPAVPGAPGAATSDGGQPSDVTPGPPPAAAVARIAGMIELAASRVVEAAGGKFRGKLQHNAEYREAFKRIPNRRLCAVAGRDLVQNLVGPDCERRLVAGAADEVLGARLNGNRDAILAEVEQLALDHLYERDGEPRLTEKALELACQEARAAS